MPHCTKSNQNEKIPKIQNQGSEDLPEITLNEIKVALKDIKIVN